MDKVKDIYFGKKGSFFSTDALIALLIILFVVVAVRPLFQETLPESDIHSDILVTLSTLKVSEIRDASVQAMIADGTIREPNKTLLEQIGEFYVFDYPDVSRARNIAAAALRDVNTTNNFGVWFGDALIFSNNVTPVESARDVDVARQIISGIEAGQNISGFAARAFLSSDWTTLYSYFGGYVGDGNISMSIYYEGNISDEAVLEIAINDDFDFYINGVLYDNFAKSTGDSYGPERYVLENMSSYFSDGENLVEFKGENLFIAGGFLKINYRGSSQFGGKNRTYNFPGIDGLINVYDGFFVPGNLTRMEIYLHMDSNYTTFLNIGNVTVYRGATSGEETVFLDDALLSGMIDYSSLEGRTTPLRLGLENASYLGIAQLIDVFSVTDLSGSMTECAIYSYPYICSYSCLLGGTKSCQIASPSLCTGNPCGGTCLLALGHTLSCERDRMALAKESNNVFIDIILNYSGNRAGLVGYATTAPDSQFHVLSNNSASLKSRVSSWSASGSTCICCGINKGVSNLVSSSTPDNFRSLVVMSDGEANVQCAQQGTGNAAQDAIKAAQDACLNYGIVTHTIGFGEAGESTMIEIANRGCNGTYYYADAEELAEVYQQIANSILTEYVEQTLYAGGGTLNTKLFSDSYISFEYAPLAMPYGLTITAEKSFDNVFGGSFYIPPGARHVKTDIVSYSGPLWTSAVSINGENVLDLDGFGVPYINLGDPYQVTAADSTIVQGMNIVNVTLGVSSSNQTSASSSDNKIIYTIVQNASSFSDVLPVASGCLWDIQLEDGAVLSGVRIPNGFVGTQSCLFDDTTYDAMAGSNDYGQISSANDAYQVATLNLLRALDLNDNGRVDVLFTQQDLQITLSEIEGIPFTYYTEVQSRTWH